MFQSITAIKTKVDYLASVDYKIIYEGLTNILGSDLGTDSPPNFVINQQLILKNLDPLYDYLMKTQSFLGPFPDPFVDEDYGVGVEPKSVLEQLLMQISSSIRQKPLWQKKINDQMIVSKWRQEAEDQGVTEKQFKYVLDELKYLITLNCGQIRISPVDGVWEADHVIDNETQRQLTSLVAVLENVPEFEKDWHPGSNHQVLDLVHPSLYCFVSGVTPVTKQSIPLEESLSIMGAGQPSMSISPFSDKLFSKEQDYSISKKYQWLPSEFAIDKNGQVSIQSYINNLHPIKHQLLYTVLEKIFECFVPMFNQVLTDLANLENKKNRIVVNSNWYDSYDTYKKMKRESEATKSRATDSSSQEESSDSFDSSDYEEYEENRLLKQPDVSEFLPPKIDKFVDLRGQTVQVIVKLANIELTPQNPNYPGGSWHVEGMQNENIVASGIYYYDSINISESHLEFRQAIKEPDYEQNDNRGVEEIYGLVDEGHLNQRLGSVITQKDRCVAFPNIYQHRVQPFSLIDPSKPGHRKILVFFLVDPSSRIFSTANVPPQQSSWASAVLKNDPISSKLMSLEEAQKYREDLMNERKFFITENNERFFERPFSLCEH